MHRLHNYSCATSLRISVKPFSNYNTNCKITILYIKHTCKNVTVCALITSESACIFLISAFRIFHWPVLEILDKCVHVIKIAFHIIQRKVK